MEAAFFDLDKTVIAKASMVAFGRPLYRAGLLNRWLLLRALYGQLVYLYLGADEERMARMRTKVLALTAGWDQAHVRDIVAETLEEVIDPIVFDEAVDLIAEHQAAGRRVFIISASPEEIVLPLARHLRVDEAIATRAAIDANGRYTGAVDFYAYGPHKAERMREIAEQRGIDLGASYAYSDSITDVPMLEVVGHPVAVNPDRDLAKVAADRGWEVRWFTRKVPLRQRVAMPSPGPTAAVGGGLLATGAAGAAAYVFLRRDRSVQETARQAAGLARLLREWGGPVLRTVGQVRSSRRPPMGGTPTRRTGLGRAKPLGRTLTGRASSERSTPSGRTPAARGPSRGSTRRRPPPAAPSGTGARTPFSGLRIVRRRAAS